MQNQLKLLENEFNRDLNELIGSGKITDLNKVIVICQYHLQKSREFFLKIKSISPTDEIYYFKQFKPRILAKLIYYRKIHEIQQNFPLGNEDVRLNYINTHLQSGFLFFNQFSAFIMYHRNKQNNLDENFFIRENARLHTEMEHRFLSLDFSHSTGYDEILAEYLALEKTQEYLERVKKDQDKINTSTISNELNSSSELMWTSTKTALVEIIYGLNAVGAVNYGKIEVKRIAFWMENTFNIQIGDIYKAYAEIKNRKGTRTKFIDTMSEALNNRMNIDEAGIN
jgi:hypothetical protein